MEPDAIVYPSILMQKGDTIKISQPWSDWNVYVLFTVADVNQWVVYATEWQPKRIAQLPRGFYLKWEEYFEPTDIQWKRIE